MRKRRQVVLIGLTGFLLLIGFLPFPVQAHDEYRVYPSGDLTGVEDVVNILAAFDAAGSGTVMLCKGDFYVADSIEVTGFEGTLKGVHSKKTTVHAVASLGSMFSFSMTDGAGLKVEKIAFSSECDSVTALEIFTNGDLTVQHCAFYGVEVGFATYDNIDSDISVKHNEFYGVGQAIFLGGPYENCEIVVSHNIVDVARHGVEVYDLDDSGVRISNNKIVGIYDSAETSQTGSAIQVGQLTRFGAEGSVAIVFNDIQGYTRWDWGYDMVNVVDYGPLSTGTYGNLESIIAFNTIELDESLWGGIGVHGGFSDTLVAFNDISGSGAAAIYVAFWSLWGLESQTGLRVILNDVTDFDAVPVPGWIDPVAPIWLGPGVYDSLVIAKGDSATVLDVSGSNTVIFIGH